MSHLVGLNGYKALVF